MPIRKNNVLPSDLPKKQVAPQPIQPPAQMTEEQAVIGADLQKTRDEMYAAIAIFRAQLQDNTLSANRSNSQKEVIDRMWKDINAANGRLESINVGEGPLALTFMALSSILTLKDQSKNGPMKLLTS